jgi:hypothetical protein
MKSKITLSEQIHNPRGNHIPFFKLPWQPLYFYTLSIFSIGGMLYEIESAQHLFLLIIHIKLIHDTRGKHLHDRIISQREEIWANKTIIAPIDAININLVLFDERTSSIYRTVK